MNWTGETVSDIPIRLVSKTTETSHWRGDSFSLENAAPGCCFNKCFFITVDFESTEPVTTKEWPVVTPRIVINGCFLFLYRMFLCGCGLSVPDMMFLQGKKIQDRRLTAIPLSQGYWFQRVWDSWNWDEEPWELMTPEQSLDSTWKGSVKKSIASKWRKCGPQEMLLIYA